MDAAKWDPMHTMLKILSPARWCLSLMPDRLLGERHIYAVFMLERKSIPFRMCVNLRVAKSSRNFLSIFKKIIYGLFLAVDYPDAIIRY